MQYKAIVFDYGGVLVINGQSSRANLMDNIGAVVGISGDEFRQEYFKHNYLTNVEGKPWVEAALSAVRVFDDSSGTEEKVRKINEDFNNTKRLNSELIEKLPELKAAGYQIAILSNYTTELRGVLAKEGINHYFDKIFVSGEIGYQKPDPKAFTAVCKGLKIEPSEMIFIDDTLRSLETADKVGYTPILFENNDQLFADFERLKVLPKG